MARGERAQVASNSMKIHAKIIQSNQIVGKYFPAIADVLHRC